jgi:CTP synthase
MDQLVLDHSASEESEAGRKTSGTGSACAGREVAEAQVRSASSANTSSCRTPTSPSTSRWHHAGIANNCKVNVVRVDAEDWSQRTASRSCSGARRHPGARRLRRPRHGGQDRGGEVRARAQDALLRALPRPADRGDRVCAQRPRHEGRQHDWSTTRRPAQPVIALMEEQKQVDREGRHDAPRGVRVRAEGRHARAQGLRQDSVSERHRHRFEVNNAYVASSSRRAW